MRACMVITARQARLFRAVRERVKCEAVQSLTHGPVGHELVEIRAVLQVAPTRERFGIHDGLAVDVRGR